jgi:hypothetical protein
MRNVETLKCETPKYQESRLGVLKHFIKEMLKCQNAKCQNAEKKNAKIPGIGTWSVETLHHINVKMPKCEMPKRQNEKC